MSVWRGLPAHSLPVFTEGAPVRTTEYWLKAQFWQVHWYAVHKVAEVKQKFTGKIFCRITWKHRLYGKHFPCSFFEIKNTVLWRVNTLKKDWSMQVVSTGHQLFNRHFAVKEKIIEVETTCWRACPEVSVLTQVHPYTQAQVRLGLHLSRCAAVCSRSSGTVRNVHLA